MQTLIAPSATIILVVHSYDEFVVDVTFCEDMECLLNYT